MNISEVRIYREKNHNLLKGFVNITFNNAICIKGIKIIYLDNKKFVSMPTYIYKDNMQNIVYPINHQTREELEHIIFSLYDEMIEKDLSFIERQYNAKKEINIDSIKMINQNFQYNTKAIFDILINNEYILKGIKLIHKNNHYFIVMPSRLVKDKHVDYYHPINKETRKQIERILISLYNKNYNNQKVIYSTANLDLV